MLSQWSKGIVWTMSYYHTSSCQWGSLAAACSS